MYENVRVTPPPTLGYTFKRKNAPIGFLVYESPHLTPMLSNFFMLNSDDHEISMVINKEFSRFKTVRCDIFPANHC